MIRPPLAAVHAFTRVVHHGNFSRAAAELQVSPSALSQTIRGLERQLGVRLLNRTTRRVGVTEQGRYFLERVLPGLTQMEEAFEALESVSSCPSGTLRINLSHIAARRWVMPRLAAFRALYPRVTVEVFADDALVDLIAEGFDAGIRLGECLARDMIAVPVSPPQELAVVASPDYVARHGAPASLSALSEHDCVRFRRLSEGRILSWEFTVDGRDVEVQVEGGLIVNDGQLARLAALSGLGLAQPLLAEVADDLRDGRLVRLLQGYTPPFDGFYIYYPAREQMASKLRVFIDFLRESV